jgi:ankyrin repeat protein
MGENYMRSRKNIVIGLCISLMGVVAIAGSMPGEGNDTRVADAAMDGNRELLRSLIKQAADVNSSQGDGMTALHWAALHGDGESVQVLISAGANLKAVTRLGSYSPLYMAAKTGSAPVIDILLKAGADAKSRSNTGITALHMAAISGDAESVRLLGERGADVNARETERGQTPLAYAASFDRPDAIKMLLKLGADPNLPSKEVPPMPLPARGENQAQPPQPQRGQQGQPPAPPAAQQARGGIPQVPGTPAAQQAAQNNGGNNNNNGADAGSRGGGNPKGLLTPLMYAARQGSTNAVRVLTEAGANLNALNGDKSTALLLTIINGHFDIAKYLVEHGADVNLFSMDGATPLYGVVNMQWARKSFHPQPSTKYEKTSYLELMTILLDRGADPNVRLYKELWYSEYNFSLESAGAVGTTAFWKCAEVGDIDGMRLLVSRGADPTLASSEGVTPLLMAAGAGVHGNDDISAPVGRLAAVKYLVEEVHLDVNAADTGGNARIQGNVQEPQQAQQGQQQAQAQQQQQQQQGFGRPSGGFTALHSAAARGDNEMIIYLVSKGAKVDAVSKNGVSVVDMANGPRQRIQPYPETVALLQMLGAKNSHKCVSC